MQTTVLNNGVEMPAIGLGVFHTPPEETTTAVAEALASCRGATVGDGLAVHGEPAGGSQPDVETGLRCNRPPGG